MTEGEDSSEAAAQDEGDGAADVPVEVDTSELPPDPAATRIAALEAQLAAAEKDKKENWDKYLRGAADLENYRKRMAREKDEVQRYGNERLVKELLPVLDNLDRALAAAGDDPLSTGVAMTRRLLEEALGRFGVKGFSAVGGAFDPRLHEALMTVASADHPPGTVVSEQQRGFFLHDRLVRPAAVVVSAAPPAAADAPATPAPDASASGGADEGAGE